MKKYFQLLLFLLAISSLSLFLVYRNEYNRLHHVLEVFNFFGQPCNLTDLETSDNITNHHDWGLEPVWKYVEGYYIYSAYWMPNARVKALALQGPSGELATKCYLWLEEQEEPVVGSFRRRILLLDLANSQSQFFYYCSAKDLKHPPYAVSFSIKDTSFRELKKVLLTVSPTIQHQNVTNTICVYPTPSNKSQLIEFISYHNLLGVDNFLFYNSDIPYRLVKIIRNLTNQLGINVAFFTWNYPLVEGMLTRYFMTRDCLLRVGNGSKYIITLEVNEFLVPVQAYSLNSVLSNYTKQVSQTLGVLAQLYCIKNADRHQPIPLQNTDIYYNERMMMREIYKTGIDSNFDDKDIIVNRIVSVHKYVYCSNKAFRISNNTSILKFSTDFIRSTLVQLNLHDLI